MGDLSEHFSKHEFRCRCGQCEYATEPDMDPRLIEALEWLRSRIGNKAMTVNSGRRCADHNHRIRGARNSQHLYGKAADIAIPAGLTPDTFAAHAKELAAFRGIGIYQTWLHLDVRDGPRWEHDYRKGI